jgi:carboxyl-terminal processing protease
MRKARSLILCFCLVPAFSASAQSLNDKANDAWLISRMVEKFHVQPRPLDKIMSSAIYSRLLDALDDEHIFFTQDDIAKLSVYRYRLDEEILGRHTSFLQLLASLYQQRLTQVDTMIDHIAAIPFKFSTREKLTAKEDTSFAASLAELHIKLYKLMKLYVAVSIAERTIAAGSARQPDPKLISSLEPALRKKFAAAIHRSIRRLLQTPTGIGNLIGIVYCQSLAECYDPHTAYFSPDEKADFESELGNKSQSYGLTLHRDDDDHAVVGHLDPGSPAYQVGTVNEGDKILSLRWDNKDSIDVSDASATELNQMLSDEGGNRLTLDVKKADGTIRRISLQKAMINSTAAEEEDNRVKGFLLKGAQTVGYIALPGFYSDWEGNNGVKGCANDVAKEILKLKKENIQALILDLRYNGGGSMDEAVELSGLFIDAGPVGQIKSKEEKVHTLKDISRGTVWDGPLLILVNGSSASASEMVAGTLQDYNRALILGSPTYGKATAQVVLPMDTSLDLSNFHPGEEASSYIKVTISRLYRVDGKTAQTSGVVPDILLPDPPEAMPERESDEPFALPPATIAANKYYHPLPPLPIAAEQALAAKIIDASPYFRYARETHRPGKQTARDRSLDIDDIIAERKPGPAQALEKNDLFTVASPAYELQRLQSDTALKEMNEQRKTAVMEDPYLMAAYQLALGMINK